MKYLFFVLILISCNYTDNKSKEVSFKNESPKPKNKYIKQKKPPIREAFLFVTQNGKKSNQILKHVIYSQEMIG